MSSVDDLLRNLEPVRDQEVARLEARIQGHATEKRGVRALLDRLDEPTDAEVARLSARVSSYRASKSQRPAYGSWLALGGMALAALTLLSVRGAWTPTPAPVTVAAVSGTLPLDGVSRLQPLQDVVLDYGGQGEATWDGKVVRIDWEEGAVTSSVTPKQGIDLSVHTREAVVSVVGTEFTVTRDVDGSHVTVQHGVVAVDCEANGSVTLRAGQSHTCAPVSAGQWLYQIDRLFSEGADSAQIQTSIGRGIRYSAVGDPLRGELLARRVQLHLRDGDRNAASLVAQQYLDEGFTVRAPQLRPIAQTAP